jgi:hypothetical protein
MAASRESRVCAVCATSANALRRLSTSPTANAIGRRRQKIMHMVPIMYAFREHSLDDAALSEHRPMEDTKFFYLSPIAELSHAACNISQQPSRASI